MSHTYQAEKSAGRAGDNGGHGAAPSFATYADRLRPDLGTSVATSGASLAGGFIDRIMDRAHSPGVPSAFDRNPAVAALDALMVCQPGWDGDRAPAPSGWAIEAGRLVVEMANREGLSPPRVTADVEGGVALYFFGGGAMADGGTCLQAGVLLANEEEASLYRRDRRVTGSQIEEIQTDATSLGAAAAKIRAFLVGR